MTSAEKGEVNLEECGPRFEMQLYEVRLFSYILRIRRKWTDLRIISIFQPSRLHLCYT